MLQRYLVSLVVLEMLHILHTVTPNKDSRFIHNVAWNKQKKRFHEENTQNKEKPKPITHINCHSPEIHSEMDEYKKICERNGTKENFSCPIGSTKQETYALCSNMNLTKPDQLNLPENITILCLRNTSLRYLPDEAFKKYRNLTYLDMSQCRNSSINVSEKAFKGLDNLRWLNMSYIKAVFIKNMTFSYLPKLAELDLSYWRPFIPIFTQFTRQHLRLHSTIGLNYTNITVLRLNGVNFESRFGILWELQEPLFRSLKHKNITHISMTHNQIIAIRRTIIVNFKHLKSFDLSHNAIIGIDLEVLFELQLLRNLIWADISHQNDIHIKYLHSTPWDKTIPSYPNQVKTWHRTRHNSKYPNVTVKVPPNLEKVYMSYNMWIRPVSNGYINFDPKNLVELVCLDHFSLEGMFTGVLDFLPHVKTLSVESSYISVNNSKILQNLTSLESLDLNNFHLDYILSNFKENWKSFAQNAHLPKLKSLDMGRNYLDYAAREFFQNLPNLTHLNLDQNKFTEIPIKINDLPKLQYLYLQENHITLDKITENLFEWGEDCTTRNVKVQIDLYKNSFYCNCGDLQTIVDLKSYQRCVKLVNFSCALLGPTSHNVTYVDLDIKQLPELVKIHCHIHFYPSVTFSLYSCVLLIGMLLATLYRFRHTIRYFCYIMTLDLKQLEHTRPCTHDAYFICPVEELKQMRCVYMTLENRYKYNLFIFERDSVGGYILDNIREPFTFCKTVILIMSKTATRGPYFEYILNLTKHYSLKNRVKVICVIAGRYSDLIKLQHFEAFEYLLQTSKCLYLEANRKPNNEFWMNIHEVMGEPIKNTEKLEKKIICH